MTMTARRSVRAILIDDERRLVLLRRVRPGQPPYWVTPGGGIEPFDADPESTLRRELLEELGATIEIRSRVIVPDVRCDAGASQDLFYLARVTSMDPSRRTGDEFRDASRGTYEVARIDLRSDGLEALDLRPEALKHFLIVNAATLLSEAGDRH